MLLNYREAKPEDKAALAGLWQTVFGDEESYINGFFENMYDRAFLCEDGDKTVSAVHLLSVGEFVCGGKTEPATVLYAFATLPEYRGAGIGGKLSDMLIQESENTFQTVCPAEESLFGYYERRYGYTGVFKVFEEKIEKLTESSFEVAYFALSAQEYGKCREQFLEKIPHIRFNEKALDYQKFLCASSGGEMVKFSIGGEEGIAAFEIYGGCAIFKEVLFDGDCKNALINIAIEKGANSAVIRKPAKEGESIRAFAMAKGEVREGYYGFAFD